MTREISITIETVNITATPRKLQVPRLVKRWRGKKYVIRVPWTIEALKPVIMCDLLDELEEQYISHFK